MKRFSYLLASMLVLAALLPVAPLIPLAFTAPGGPRAENRDIQTVRCGEPHTAEPPTGEPDGDEIPCTPTPVGTPTAVACEPRVVTADFSGLAAGDSVEGLGVVAPDLDIEAGGTAVKVVPGGGPFVYNGGNASGNFIQNGGIAAGGGFGDTTAFANQQAPQFTFSFAPGVAVSEFSVHMLDYGDWNPTAAPTHFMQITAYDAGNAVVDQDALSFTSSGEIYPTSSDQFGNMQVTGDAMTASDGEPGNWTWHVSGAGIVKVTLVAGAGFDAAIGFDTLSYTVGCPTSCQPRIIVADFARVSTEDAVESPGAVAPDLTIDAAGTAVKVVAGADPFAYNGGNATGNLAENGGLTAGGGFSDTTAFTNQQAPSFAFSFSPTVSVGDFSLHMLDYGDWNPTSSTAHSMQMTAYDAGNAVVDQQTLSYSSPADLYPTASAEFGNLQVNGDALTAPTGQPGNWTWHVSGTGITRITLTAGAGFDPAIAFDTLQFATGCP